MIGPEHAAIVRKVIRQADRYLMAAEQDTSPAYGLVHASYAMAAYEALTVAGVNVRDRIAAAAAQQDRWGLAIRRASGEGVDPAGCKPAASLGLGAWIRPNCSPSPLTRRCF